MQQSFQHFPIVSAGETQGESVTAPLSHPEFDSWTVRRFCLMEKVGRQIDFWTAGGCVCIPLFSSVFRNDQMNAINWITWNAVSVFTYSQWQYSYTCIACSCLLPSSIDHVFFFSVCRKGCHCELGLFCWYLASLLCPVVLGQLRALLPGLLLTKH